MLDSDERERRPAATEILELARAQVALIRPDPGSRALESIMRDLIATRDGTRYFADRVSASDLRYDLGDAHPLVWRSAPDFEFADKSRLGGHLRGGGGLPIDFSSDDNLRSLVKPWNGRVAYRMVRSEEDPSLDAALIRPGGIVAWATDHPIDLPQAKAATSRWFGDGD